MGIENDIAVLASVSVFSGLDQEQLRLIAFGAEPTELPAGRLLCRLGEIADGGFVLVSGTLTQLAENGETSERSFSKTGTLIGELSLLTRCVWQSSIVAQTPCRLLRLPRPLIRRILEEYPQTALALEKAIASGLSAEVRLMENVARKLG